jgi:RNA polymerase sigma-70 factor, ECF subfamily
MHPANVLTCDSHEDSIRAGLQPRRSGETAAPFVFQSRRSFLSAGCAEIGKWQISSRHCDGGAEAPPLPNNAEKRRLSRDDFAQIYQEFHPKVLMICRRMLGSPQEAEDAANDVFLKLPDSLESYDSSQPFDRWLARVASNHCIDLLRRRRSEQPIIQPEHHDLPEPAAPLRSPVDDLVSKESSDVVRDAIFALPERYLVPLVMRYFSDLSYNEIARTLGTSKANVGLLIFRAKQQLRSILAGREIQPRRGANRKRVRQTGSQRGASGWLGQPAAVLGAP